MTTTTGPDLSELSADDFSQIVDSELRAKVPPEVAAALRAPANLDRWVAALEEILISVEGQLTVRADDYLARRALLEIRIEDGDAAARPELHLLRSEYFKRRSGTIRFKSGLEERLHEARFLRERALRTPLHRQMTEERNQYALQARRLSEAIAAHRRALEDDDIEPSEADERLWAALDLTT